MRKDEHQQMMEADSVKKNILQKIPRWLIITITSCLMESGII